MVTKKEACKECGCRFETKYMIRIDYTGWDDKNKSHFESTTKRSVVGWLKLIMNEFTSNGFDTITIYDLIKTCRSHQEFYNKNGK